MKVLIFGCNGFVGNYLAREFFNSNYCVIASDCVECNPELRKYIDRYYIANILDYESICDIIRFEQPDYLVNLAAISSVGISWSIPQKTMEVNVNGCINILEAIKKYSILTKVLLVGSSEEYEVSRDIISEEYPICANNPYGISKVTQEQFANLYRNEFGLNIVCTRTFNHTGPGQSTGFAIPSFVKQVAEIQKNGCAGAIFVGNLSAIRDLGDVRDMTRAYRIILEGECKHELYNVGSGRCYCLEEIVNYIIGLSEQKIEIIIDQQKLRPLDNPIIWCDNSRLRNDFEWEPQYTIYDAINEMYKEMTN